MNWPFLLIEVGDIKRDRLIRKIKIKIQGMPFRSPFLSF